MEYSELLSGNNYLLVVAHPDDELYSCALLKRLVEAGKNLHVIFITSGDAGTSPEIREKEALESMKLIGVNPNKVHFLRIQELQFPKKIKDVVQEALQIAKLNKIDFVIGQDYEGGHEGHDLASYCASEIRNQADIKSHAVYPVYHGKPAERKGARFKPTRTEYITMKLSDDEKKLKEQVLSVHAGQKSHFDGLQKSSSDYLDLLLSREVYFIPDSPIDYTEKPSDEVGYEFHRNGFKFRDFQAAINQ